HTRSKRDWSSDVCSSDLSEPRDFGVWRAVVIWQLRCVQRIVPGVIEVTCKSCGKLGVDEEFHAAPSGTTRCPPAVRAPNSSAAKIGRASGRERMADEIWI